MADDFFDELDGIGAQSDADSGSHSDGGDEASLQKLASLVEDLNRDLSTSTILERAMSAAIELTGAERGFLVLVGENGDWNFRVARNMETGEIENAASAASHTMIRKVLDGRQPILINDVVGASDLTKQQSIARMQVRSIMGAPLIAKGNLMGMAYVDTSRLAGVFDRTSLVLFETFVQLAAVALENARLIEAEQKAKAGYQDIQEYLTTVLSSQPHGIIILDGTLRIEYANPQAATMLECKALTPGANFGDSNCCDVDVMMKLLENLREFVDHSAVHRATFVRGRRTLAYSFFPVHRTWGGGVRVGIIMEDITSQKQLEHKVIESEKQSTINQLAGGIAHEINNSLQPVKGRVELLAMRLKQAGVPLENGIERDLETISNLSTRIEKIAWNLRHLTKPAKPDFEPVDLKKVVMGTVELMESTTGTLRGFSSTDPRALYRLELDIEDNLPLIMGDAHALESAIINTILNSCHAIRNKGRGTLTLRVQAGSGTVTLAISDTGGGIPADVMPHIFEPYFTTHADNGGTGLGMCVLQNVAEIHGAKLDLQSQWGDGTTISVAFPVLKQENVPES